MCSPVVKNEDAAAISKSEYQVYVALYHHTTRTLLLRDRVKSYRATVTFGPAKRFIRPFIRPTLP